MHGAPPTIPPETEDERVEMIHASVRRRSGRFLLLVCVACSACGSAQGDSGTLSAPAALQRTQALLRHGGFVAEFNEVTHFDTARLQALFLANYGKYLVDKTVSGTEQRDGSGDVRTHLTQPLVGDVVLAGTKSFARTGGTGWMPLDSQELTFFQGIATLDFVADDVAAAGAPRTAGTAMLNGRSVTRYTADVLTSAVKSLNLESGIITIDADPSSGSVVRVEVSVTRSVTLGSTQDHQDVPATTDYVVLFNDPGNVPARITPPAEATPGQSSTGTSASGPPAGGGSSPSP